MQPLNVLIAADDKHDRQILRTHVERLGHLVVAEVRKEAGIVAAAASTRLDAAILEVKLPVMDGIRVAQEIMNRFPCAILFVSDDCSIELAKQAAESGGMAYLTKPIRGIEIGPALAVAICRFRELVGQQKEIAMLKEALETRKLIGRAKGILMTRYNLSEEEAFRKIHFLSRNQHRKIQEVAKDIIDGIEFVFQEDSPYAPPL
ncbi:MAG TPA: ANTAR domain-containing protein [Chthonomonadales bacterium]|nr:ANTAR domain-containing protein [Chthonomonadales bacterium]